MAYTLDQAFVELAKLTKDGPTTKDALINLVRQVSVEASGSVTVFYSGMMSDQTTKASAIVDGMLASDKDIRVLDKSAAGEFLKSPEFKNAVANIFKTTVDELEVPGSASKLWLDDTKNGPWADASKRFAAATVGEVRYIGPESEFARMFGQTEMHELLNSGKVTSIEGIPIAELKSVLASGGEAAVFERIKLTSLAHVAFSGLDSVATGADDFLNKVNDVDYVKNHPEAITRFNDYVKDYSDAEKAEIAALSKTMMSEAKVAASAGTNGQRGQRHLTGQRGQRHLTV